MSCADSVLCARVAWCVVMVCICVGQGVNLTAWGVLWVGWWVGDYLLEVAI